MSFQITFTGQVLKRNIFYSTKANREDKYFGEFCKKMDALAKEIKQQKTEEENNLPIEEKLEEMVALAAKEFTVEVLDDCDDGGDEYYCTHYSGGELEVDGEEIELDKDFYGDDHKEWEEALSERLNKLDWHIIFSTTWDGFHNNGDWDGIEGEFDKKKIKLKDTCIYYDDSPIASPDGCDWERELILYVGNDESMEVEPEWAEDEEGEE